MKLLFLSRYTAAELPTFLTSLLPFIAAPDASETDAISDYTGLLPLECKDLRDFVEKQHQAAAATAAAAGAPAAALQWWPLLAQWKASRLEYFDQLLAQYDARAVGSDASVARFNASRVLALCAPMEALSVQFDRRLMFSVKCADHLMRLEALSPLVQLAVMQHYRHAPSAAGVDSFDRWLGDVLADTQLLTNDAKGRIIEGYILHCIRTMTASKAHDQAIPFMHGGAPWQAEAPAKQAKGAGAAAASSSATGGEDVIDFLFSSADVVHFPGAGVPAASLLGDVTRPKFYLPLRSNYPEFDLFLWQPAQAVGPKKRKFAPSKIVRCSVTVDISGHGYNPNLVDAAVWTAAMPNPLPVAPIEDSYVWIGVASQNAPVAARHHSLLLSLEALADHGFPLLKFVKLK